MFSTEDSTTGAGPPVMVNGTLVIDANTPRRFYVRHTSMATAANYFTVTSDSVFKHSDRGVYLEETTMPVNSTEVYADGSSEPYTTLTLAVREEADKVAWVNDTNSHSIISFVSSVGVLNRIPASLSSGWVTHKVDVDQLVVGETVTLKFHSTHESIDNQLFTSKMQPTVEDQEEYDDGIERKEVTIEIDLGNMKSVDFLTKVPEEYDILKYNGTKWVAASDKIIHDSDVFYDLATIDTGHVLAWDADAFKQSSSPLPPSILDTSVSSAGEILVSTGEVWTNVVPNLNLNSDLQYDPETITAGKALVWDVDLAQFIPGEGVVPPVEFDATAMVDGQILVWDTDKFIPTISPLPPAIMDTTAVQEGEILIFQDGAWVSRVPGLNDNIDAQYDPATIAAGQALVWDADLTQFVPGEGVVPPVEFDATAMVDGQILVWDTDKFIPTISPLPPAITDITTVQEGETLSFQDGAWVSKVPGLNDNFDAEYDPDTITQGQALVWDTDKFVPTISAIPTIITDTTTVQEGEILIFQGGEWVSKIPGLNDNLDAQYDPATIAAGQALVWDADLTQFVPGEGVVPPVEFDATAMVDGQILVWDTDKFIPTISPLPPVITDTTTVQEGETLSFQGGEWVSKVPGLNDNFDAEYDPATITQGQALVWDADLNQFVVSGGTLPRFDIDPLALENGQALIYSSSSESWVPTSILNYSIDYRLTGMEMVSDELVATVSAETDEITSIRIAISMVDIDLYNNGTDIYLEDSHPRGSDLKIFRGTVYGINLGGVWNGPLILSEELDGTPYTTQVTLDTPTRVVLAVGDQTPDRLYFREDGGAAGGFLDILPGEEGTFHKSQENFSLQEEVPETVTVARNDQGADYVQYPNGFHDPSSGDDIIQSGDGIWITTDLSQSVDMTGPVAFLENSEPFPPETIIATEGAVPGVQRYLEYDNEIYYVPDAYSSYASLSYSGTCVAYKGMIGTVDDTISSKNTSSFYNAYYQDWPIVRSGKTGVWYTLTDKTGYYQNSTNEKAWLDDADGSRVFAPFVVSAGKTEFCEYEGRILERTSSVYDGVILRYYISGYSGYGPLKIGSGARYKWSSDSSRKTWITVEGDKYLINVYDYDNAKWKIAFISTSNDLPTYDSVISHYTGGQFFNTVPAGKTSNVDETYSQYGHPHLNSVKYTFTTLGSGQFPSNYDQLDRYEHKWIQSGATTRVYRGVSGNSIIAYKSARFVEETPAWVRLGVVPSAPTENSTLTILDDVGEVTLTTSTVGSQGHPDSIQYVAYNANLGSDQYPVGVGTFRDLTLYNLTVKTGNYPMWVNSSGSHSIIHWEEDETIQGRELLPVRGTGWYVFTGDVADIQEGFNIVSRNPYIETEIMQKLAKGDQGELWPVSGDITPVTAILEEFVRMSLGIDQLNDVSTGGAATGEILSYQGTEWVNRVPELQDNRDVQYDPATITQGQALVWDADLTQFVPGEGIVPPVDIDATTMVDGQILVWDTDKFIPTISPLPTVITDTTTVQDGETLVFQGGEWVSKVPGLNDNFDAQYDPATITQGQILVWDTDKFVPGTTGFSSVPPLDGEILVFDDASGLWTPVTHYDCHLTKLNFLNGSLFATVSGCKIEGEFGLRFLHEDSFINSFTVEKYAFATTNLNFINESNENFTIFRRDELNVNTLLNIFNSPSIIFSELSGGEEYPPSAPFSIQYTTYTQLSLSAYPDTLHWRARDTLDVGSGIFNIRANDELLFSPTPSAYYLEELEPTVRAVGIDHYGFGYNTYSLSTSPTGHIVSSSETAFNTETTFYPFVENILRTHDGVWYVTFHENLDRWNIDTYVDPPFAPPSTAKEKNFIQEHLDGNLTLFPPAAIRAHFGRTPFSRSDKGFTSGFADAGGYGQYYYFFYNGDIFYLPDVCNEAEIFLTHSDGVTKIQELSIDQNLSIFQSATSERCIAWVEGGDDVSPESGWRLYEQDIPFDFRVIVNESTAQAVAARAHIRENSSLYPFTAAATYLPEFGKWSNVHFPLCTPRGTIIREYKEAGSDEFPNLGTFRNDVLYRFTLREGPEPGGQVEYPSWQNNEKSISLVYWDENPAIANRELLPFRSKYWYPYTGDITLLNDGDEIEIRSNYTENFFMRKLMKGPELYPAPTNESNPLVVYGNGSTYGDMLVTTTINLENMNDTDFSVSPQVGQILTMGSAGKWIAQNDSLSNNEDVNLTVAPADNQVLSFDISTGKWIPRDPVLVQDYYATSIDIGDNGVLTALVTNEVDGEVKSINTTVNLNNLGDVSIPTTPEEGDILTYNASGNFMPGKQYILNALDVNYNATTMINNHVLVWNSTSKIFQESQGILPHFEFSNAVGGDILIMDGGVWKNYSPHLSINSDVDFDETSIRDGSFLTWSGDKFVESSFAFDLTDLLNGDLLRFNQLTNKFENFTPVVGDQGTSTDPSTTTELSNVTIQDGIIEFGSTTPEYITFSF